MKKLLCQSSFYCIIQNGLFDETISTSQWINKTEFYSPLTQSPIGWRRVDALLHRVSQEPRLILSGGPLFPGPWRHQMNPVFGWQINKEREVHVEGHPEGFYEPGLGLAYITFTHIPRIRLH